MGSYRWTTQRNGFDTFSSCGALYLNEAQHVKQRERQVELCGQASGGGGGKAHLLSTPTSGPFLSICKCTLLRLREVKPLGQGHTAC